MKLEEESGQKDIADLVPVAVELDDKIRRLDALINEYGAFLDMIQPFAPGKLSVRFMVLHGGRRREPVFISWKYTRATRQTRELKFYDILPPDQVVRHVKRYGPFKGTEADVRFLLSSLREMIERRKALMTAAGRFRQAIRLSLDAAERAYERNLAAYRAEHLGLVSRHRDRRSEWRQEQEEKAREQAELDARGALPIDENGDYFQP